MNTTIEEQESIDFFDSSVRSEIERGIVDALDESDEFTIEIAYDAVNRKFIRSQNVKGHFIRSKEIIIVQIEPWSLLDDGLDISVAQLKAMTEDEKKDIAENCAEDWIEQYDHAIEEARKLLPGYQE